MRNDPIFLPCVEPPRCFLSSQSHDKRLSASPIGEVSLSENRKEWEEWLLVPMDDGSIVFQSAKHGFDLTVSQDGGRVRVGTTKSLSGSNKWILRPCPTQGGLSFYVVFVETMRKLRCDCTGALSAVYSEEVVDSDSLVWKVEFLSGELCLFSNPDFDRRIQCNINGNLTMDKNWKGWEVWRFIEVGNGELVITSWTHHSNVLCSNDKCKVYTSKNKFGGDAKWRVSRASNGVFLQSVAHPHAFLCYDGKSLVTTHDAKAKGVQWHLESANRQIFYISSPTRGKQVSSKVDGTSFTTCERKEREKWKIKRTSNGWFSIYSPKHEKYLGSTASGKVYTTSQVSKYEEWDFEESPHGGFFVISRAQVGRVLACNNNGDLHTTSCGTEELDTTWKLEPCMPAFISGRAIWSLNGAVIGAVALTVAAPFAVVGLVGFLGFGAGGIVSSSIAAGMMSAEAIAAGGGVVAGGTVATLQSIGAAGLGVAGTSAALGGGALIGGAVVGSTAAIVGRGVTQDELSTTQTNENLLQENACRPLAAWRSWRHS